MTCVLPASASLPGPGLHWASMSYHSGHMTAAGDAPHHDYASSIDSEPRKMSTANNGIAGGGSGSGITKKRPSRAGTRSVSTLSALQLERKRANDREAQRAIRQRTKDHISSLERNISDLQMAQQTSSEILAAVRQRNRELEEENVYLRARLSELGYPTPMSTVRTNNQRPQDTVGAQMQSTSPSTQASGSSIVRPGSTSLTVATSRSSGSRHSSWPHGQQPMGPTSSTQTANAMGTNLTSWRSHDGATHGLQTSPISLQDGTGGGHTAASYNPSTPTDRSAPWQPSSAPPFGYQDQNRPHFQPTTHTEYQSLAVSSPTAYTMPAAQYAIGMQPDVSHDFNANPQPGQMQPPPLPAAVTQFQGTPQTQFGPTSQPQPQQQPQPPQHHHQQQQQQQHQTQQQQVAHQQPQQRMNFTRNDPAAMGYAIPHYSTS